MPEAPPPMSKLDPVLIASRWICGDLLPENIPQPLSSSLRRATKSLRCIALLLKTRSTVGIRWNRLCTGCSLR